MAAESVTSASAYVAQAAVASDQATNEPSQDLAVALAEGLAQRASALAQAIGTFDLAGVPQSVATPSLSVPVDSYGATMRSATLAVGNLVDQMRSFDSQSTSASAVQAGVGTAAPSALTAMQVAPIGILDPLKNSVLNDFSALSGNNFNKP